ncbi:MAG: family 20 glycosylhydrolase [Bacteroidales bacterium]|nr:family 20 glycosylhydrolase [Bacteroidales bacterium]
MTKLYFSKVLLFILCGGFFSCSSGTIQQANFNVIPLPQELESLEGSFLLNNKTSISYPEDNPMMEQNANFLAEYIYQSSGNRLEVTKNKRASNTIVLATGLEDENSEAYTLEVTNENISIVGASEAGVFYGIQTLRKSMPLVKSGDISFPTVKIYDYPRFSYRGSHLDVSRHFFTADSIKRFIDILALHNINRFHWHLTDDQGWRIEIKKRPELTTIGSKRKNTVIGRNSGEYDTIPYEGFYTQDEVKEIVNYAQERYITIIPEIDLPGHMQAALSAYPELGCTGGPYEVWRMWGVSEDVLCAGNDKTLEFIKEVLDEIVELFPSEYIHVGGDECPKTRWEKCPKCQAKIKSLGLMADKDHTSEQKLQSYIISYAEKVLREKNRKIIGWEEILEGGLAPNATVMSWLGVEGGYQAAKQKHNAIMTPSSYLYFDYYQTIDTEKEPLAIGGYVPLEKVYSFEPISENLSEEEAKYIIGVQANLWTEYILNFKHAEYMLMPRMAALSEVQWSMPEKKDYGDFIKRLPQLISIYDLNNYNYAKHIFDVNAEYLPNIRTNKLDIVLTTIDNAPIYYTLDGSVPTENSTLYLNTLSIDSSCILKAVTIRNNERSSVLEENLTFNKASLKPITLLKPINEKYRYNGELTLVDGLSGTKNYRTGRWIAFYENDMEVVVDLLKEEAISKIWVRSYVEIGEEILDLRKLSVSISNDGKQFKEIKTEVFPPVAEESKNGIFTYELTFDAQKARYVKIDASPEYKIPDWHWGKGRPAFIFIDEIGIE